MKIIINDKEYKSLKDVPAHLRDLIKDQNKDGIPDAIEESVKKGRDATYSNTVRLHDKALEDITPKEKAELLKRAQRNPSLFKHPTFGPILRAIEGTNPKPESFQPRVKKDNRTKIIIIIAILGLLGWLFITYGDIFS